MPNPLEQGLFSTIVLRIVSTASQLEHHTASIQYQQPFYCSPTLLDPRCVRRLFSRPPASARHPTGPAGRAHPSPAERRYTTSRGVVVVALLAWFLIVMMRYPTRIAYASVDSWWRCIIEDVVRCISRFMMMFGRCLFDGE